MIETIHDEKDRTLTCRLCDNCFDEIEYQDVYFTDSEGNQLCRYCAKKMMIDMIVEQLDTLELFELMQGAGFKELTRHDNDFQE